MNQDLFAQSTRLSPRMDLAEGATLLRGWALDDAKRLLEAVNQIAIQAPFRCMETPSGRPMAVEMSNCGVLGWVSDRRGYRYTARDPKTSLRWPPMPESFTRLAVASAEEAGFANFEPDVCLINRYSVGTALNLHQDKDEQDFSHPIVSVSFGLPGVFVLGGLTREAPVQATLLEHGDVLVFGGPSRLRFHGVREVRQAHTVSCRFVHRINLTFRRAGA